MKLIIGTLLLLFIGCGGQLTIPRPDSDSDGDTKSVEVGGETNGADHLSGNDQDNFGDQTYECRADETMLLCHFAPGHNNNKAKTIEVSCDELVGHITNHSFDSVGPCEKRG